MISPVPHLCGELESRAGPTAAGLVGGAGWCSPLLGGSAYTGGARARAGARIVNRQEADSLSLEIQRLRRVILVAT